MNLKKKLNVSLISVLGVGISLTILVVGVFILQKNLVAQKAKASPATCTVNDDLSVQGDLAVTGTLGMECKIINGGCVGAGGNAKACSANAGGCFCNHGEDLAWVSCPLGYVLVSGGCICDSGSFAKINYPLSETVWKCDWDVSVSYERAFAICCKIAWPDRDAFTNKPIND